MAAEAAAPFVGAERDGRGYFASTGEGSIAWRRTLILKRTPHFCVHLHNKEATCNTLHHLDYRATALSSQWEQFDRPPSSVPPYPSSSSTKCLRGSTQRLLVQSAINETSCHSPPSSPAPFLSSHCSLSLLQGILSSGISLHSPSDYP